MFGDLDLALGIGADDAPRGGDAERDATASARASLGIGFGLDDEGSDFEDDVDFGTVSAAAAAAAESTGSAGLGIAGRRAGRSMTTGGSIGRLDADVCTFVSSGSSFMEQHWYFCYTSSEPDRVQGVLLGVRADVPPRTQGCVFARIAIFLRLRRGEYSRRGVSMPHLAKRGGGGGGGG